MYIQNKMARRISFAYLVCFSLGIFIVQAQQAEKPLTLSNTCTYDLHSTLNGGDYVLEVSAPPGHDAFMLLFMGMQQSFIRGEASASMKIVGIGYPVKTLLESMPIRTRDYTPTQDLSFDTMLTNYLHSPVPPAGAPMFLETLSKEIIRFIEKRYRVSEDTAIAGHSFGALFRAYTLFHQRSLFNRYLLSSISLQWDNGSLLNDEKAFLQPARVIKCESIRFCTLK
jgi:hypothetical protein